MYILYGQPFEIGRTEEPEPVALFSTEDKVIDYIEKSYLANPTARKRFKQNSMLGGYASAYFEDYVEDELPIDPTMD